MIRPSAESVRLTFSLDATLGGLQRLLMGSMVQRTMDAEVRMLDNAKRLPEASGPTSDTAGMPAPDSLK